MNIKVFYSWQSDCPEELCHYFIRDASNLALKNIGLECEVEESPRLDHDTKNESGMPEIAATIFTKIQDASFFLADLTYVSQTEAGKKSPNPNVLVELGFAAKALGWERIICVMNEKFGERSDQIFNVRHRRFPIGYTLSNRNDRKKEIGTLSGSIKNAIKALLWVENNKVEEVFYQFDMYCITFIHQYHKDKAIYVSATNQITIGAPVGTLDTSGFNNAVDKLLGFRIIECRVENGTNKFIYVWTYFGKLVIRKMFA